MKHDDRNHEGYHDPTAYEALKHVPDDIDYLLKEFRAMASLLGYDITNRIEFTDRSTGKRWK